MELAARKSALRREIRACRDRVQRAAQAPRVERAGERLATVLVTVLLAEGVAELGLYAALPGELPTRPLFEAARSAGLRCLLPRCSADRGLDFHCVEAWDELRPGRYGVLEPPEAGRVLRPGAGSWVVLPGVAFDRRGGRLGRGAGTYDRYFPRRAPSAPILCGAGFSFQILGEVPTGDRDRRVDYLFDESELSICRGV